MSYALCLRSAPGHLFSTSEIDKLLQEFQNETNLDGPCEVTELYPQPEDFDLEMEDLSRCFDRGEFTRSEFDAFCVARGVDSQAGEQDLYEAAFLFLVTKRGQDLIVLKLPPCEYEDNVRDAYCKIVDFARRHNLIISDRQAGCDVTLDTPGEFPPFWNPPQAKPDAVPKRKWWMWWKQ
jgi:hypothetical protein